MIKEIHDGFFTWYLDTDTGDRYLERPKVATTYVVIVSKIGQGIIFKKTYQNKIDANAVYDELKSGIQKPCLLYIASNRSTVNNKTKYKGLPDKKNEYMQSKQYINSLYGMMVTKEDPIQ